MAQLVSLVLIAVGGLGLYWIFGRHRPLPDPSGVQA
jgi:phosphatidylglycerol:prolipoprotein diacylglycerol transferase